LYYSYERKATSRLSFSAYCASFRGYEQPKTKEGAFFKAAEFSNMPVIILVNPFLDQNVGSVARSMLNFGLTELRVVDPRCDIKSDNSKALAAGAIDILEYAKIFPTLKECISDLQVVMATTIRPRDMTQTIVSPSRAASIIASSDRRIRAGILFGTERSGLTNEDVAMADTIITIPTFGHFSSINLGGYCSSYYSSPPY
jgi:TrmH family RNA methyltransferase